MRLPVLLASLVCLGLALSACEEPGARRRTIAETIARTEQSIAKQGVRFELYITKSDSKKSGPKLKGAEATVKGHLEALAALAIPEAEADLRRYRDLRVKELTLALEHAGKMRTFFHTGQAFPELGQLEKDLKKLRAEIAPLETSIAEIRTAREALRPPSPGHRRVSPRRGAEKT